MPYTKQVFYLQLVRVLISLQLPFRSVEHLQLHHFVHLLNPEAQMHVTQGYAYLQPDVLIKVGYTGDSYVKSVIPAVNATRAGCRFMMA